MRNTSLPLFSIFLFCVILDENNVAEIIKREDCSIKQARKMLEADETDDLKLVVYDRKKKALPSLLVQITQ